VLILGLFEVLERINTVVEHGHDLLRFAFKGGSFGVEEALKELRKQPLTGRPNLKVHVHE